MADLIDRQAAIDAINHICPVDTEYDCTLLDRVDVRYVLSDLPSAQPEYDLDGYSSRLWKAAYERGKKDAEAERKMGRWVHGREIAREMIGDAITAIFYDGWQCSECECIVEEEREPLWKFCPNCGADMRGNEDG